MLKRNVVFRCLCCDEISCMQWMWYSGSFRLWIFFSILLLSHSIAFILTRVTLKKVLTNSKTGIASKRSPTKIGHFTFYTHFCTVLSQLINMHGILYCTRLTRNYVMREIVRNKSEITRYLKLSRGEGRKQTLQQQPYIHRYVLQCIYR